MSNPVMREKGSKESVTFSIRVPRRLKDDIEAAAKTKGHTRNQAIVTFLEFALEQFLLAEMRTQPPRDPPK